MSLIKDSYKYFASYKGKKGLKRGDTLKISSYKIKRVGIDLTGSTARCQIRDVNKVLLASATVTVTFPVLGEMKIEVEVAPSVTNLFPIEVIYGDIEITYAGGLGLGIDTPIGFEIEVTESQTENV